MTPGDVKLQCDRIGATLDKSIDALCAKVRQENIIPFCDKRNVRFVAGMGGWSFTNTKGDSAAGADWDEWALPKRLKEILNTDLPGHGQGLGSMCEDYTPKGFR